MTTFMIVLALATYGGLATVTARAMAPRRAAAGIPPASALAIAALGNSSIGLLVLAEQVWIGGKGLADLGLGWAAADGWRCLAIAATTIALAFAFAGAAHPRRRPPALLVVALLCGAWMEEVLFRGFLLAWLHPLGTVAALLASSVAFTAIHLRTPGTDRYKVIDWLGGGLYLGVVYLLSGSVWVTTAAHLARNLANVWLLPPRDQTATGRRLRSLQYAALGLATVVVAVITR